MACIADDDDRLRNDFLSAMGAEFCMRLSPPIPVDEIDPHECCEVIWNMLGDNVTPSDLAEMSDLKQASLAQAFGEYFECSSPRLSQIKAAVDATLLRWPVGSLGELADTALNPSARRDDV